MKTTIMQTITNILNEDRSIKSSITVESYVLTPEKGKVLKNIKTGDIVSTKICVTKKIKVADYVEIDNPNA